MLFRNAGKLRFAPGNTALGLAVLLAASATLAEEREPRITFLDAQQAAEAIVDDELEPYFSRLQPLEMSAKTGRAITGNGLDEQQEECRRRYSEATLDFTAEEIAVVQWAISEVHPYLAKHYAKVAALEWQLIKLDAHIEGSLPHTRGPYIVVPPSLLNIGTAWADKSPVDKLSVLGAWLLHEQLHVAQRKHPELFHKLYTELWGFRRVEFDRIHPWMIKYQLTNPDALSGHWIYPLRSGNSTTWIWPTLVLGQSRGIRRLLGVPSLSGDMRMVAVELVEQDGRYGVIVNENGIPAFHRLLSLQIYRREFPYALAPFHPNEIAAESFARMVIMDLAAQAPDGRIRIRRSSDQKTAALRRWFAEHLN